MAITKQKFINAICVAIFLVGVGLLVYPAISNMYYEYQQEKLSDYYSQQVVEEIEEEELDEEFQECWDYNASLMKGGAILTDPFNPNQLRADAMPYAGLLNTDGQGTMGYIEIPSINVKLMIYHGTDAEILAKGVGHLQGTSLPVGGTGSHCVLSAHTGLNDKKLFTDLDQLVEGDVFYIHVLGEVLAYQVDQINIVTPDNVEDLKINANQDYCTLVTCTPYGINTHRLLVRGTRIAYEEAKNVEETMPSHKSTWASEYMYAISLGIGLVIILLICLLIIKLYRTKKKFKKGRHV